MAQMLTRVPSSRGETTVGDVYAFAAGRRNEPLGCNDSARTSCVAERRLNLNDSDLFFA